ncbi:sigma-70 family RNA polymerase sigma factor [Sphingomonas sp. G-3-2-10]|uniref:sigma-70 family RNA polymerase sigma factor n=1 Tax=Sphingomonas sp. G-3-2-10 TaxID=2728838 RepID=UPI00146A3EEE|nr:sigma-70 family RNA polymerase sigma factor [Sphingomonas sp. G-3-2-10]
MQANLMSPPFNSTAALGEPDDPSSGPGLEMIYRDERHALVRFITRYRSNAEDAGDVAQEAFLRLAQSERTRTEPIARPGAFLRQIARNLLRDRAKSAAGRGEVLSVPFDEQAISAANEVARLEARDSLARVEAVMRRMKPMTREIFMAHRLDGLSYGEIAERTGMSISGIEKQMAKAMTMLLRHADKD